ncbi:MAG: glycosyltransferase family 9 protein [Actinomycetota bacterium]|nr:glycosyltransferase family 9 protein [Actinomycetota bacterium]
MALISGSRPRLVVLRALGLGDLVSAVPALRAIRAARPDHEILLATPQHFEPLLRLADAVDRVLPAAGLQPLRWMGPPPDVAVNLHGRGPQSHRLLADVHPGELLAFRCPAAGHEGPDWNSAEHEVQRWCRLVQQGWSCPADPADLRLRPPRSADADAAAVVVHPGAAFPARRWPPERFAEVARWADQRGLPVRITGSTDEVDIARGVARMAGLEEAALVAGRTSIRALAELVSTARLVVSGDTGIAHLAFAFGTPSVTMYGPTSPELWGPPQAGPHVALWNGVASKQPFALEPDPALLAINADTVVAAAQRLISLSVTDAHRSGS